jgi:hypothetical protein
VGCHNSQYREGPRGVKFHSFPKNKDRRTQWILIVKREKEGKPWKPSSSKQNKVKCMLFQNVIVLLLLFLVTNCVQNTSSMERVMIQTVRITFHPSFPQYM